MTFNDLNAMAVLARERQQQLIAEAAERRVERLARLNHPSTRRRRRRDPSPPAAA